MKKVFLVTCFLLSILANAQDVIILQNSERIDAIITEVSSEEIRYKKFSNQEGPTFVLKTNEIAVLMYKNGEIQVFNQPVQNAPAKQEKSITFHNNPGGNKYDNNYVEDYINVVNYVDSVDIRVVGFNHKLGVEQPVANYSFCNHPIKVYTISNVPRGTLDHYSSFSIIVESKKEVRCFATAINEDLFITIDYPQNLSIPNNVICINNSADPESDAKIRDYIFIYNYTEKPINVDLYEDITLTKKIGSKNNCRRGETLQINSLIDTLFFKIEGNYKEYSYFINHQDLHLFIK